ncbi:hypothetical protein ASH02_06150 [Nocardioides sp. Soil796]|nr:hypothetical protein ASH02_06150 [Nocardioides sp. Soil796]
MHKIIGAALALATTVCLTAGTMSSAHAEKVVHRDARGDVIRVDYSDESGKDTQTPTPNTTAGDITATVVDHRRDNVFVTVRYVDLRPRDEMQGHFISLITNERIRRDITVFVFASSSLQGDVEMTTGASKVVKCSGLRTAIDYRANTLRLRVPRSCLSNPRWVRAGIGTFRSPADFDRMFVDDAGRAGEFRNAGPAYGARVHRG